MKKILITLFLGSFLLSGYSYAGDFTRYAKCYGEMTTAHKARGFHQSHRMMSIQIKEKICTAYSNYEINNYEGKK